MPKELEHRARMEAAKRGISRSELVRQAIEQFLPEMRLESPRL